MADRKPDHLIGVVGEALYGPQWRAQMASALDVSERTVRRWAAGTFEVPQNVWTELGQICIARRNTLARLAKELAAP